MTPEIRALFPVTERLVYFNHAAISPPPIPTIRAIEAQLKDVHENGSLNFRSWLAVKEDARKLLANLLGAKPEQVAFVRNTSDALSTVANGFNWRAGDNIVTFGREFPSNVYPWLRIRDAFGVEVRMCEEHDGRIDLAEFESLIDDHTRIVAVSHVQYASGFRTDLARLGQVARRYGALFVVDAIQALGAIPTNVEADFVDVAAGASHKWLLAPEGVGYLYLSDRARERIQPTLVGWTSVPDPDDYLNFEQAWNRGTLAWETGTGPAALVHGFKASLELLQSHDVEKIANYLEDLTDYLCERLNGKNYEVVSSRARGEKSQIVCIRHRGKLSSMALYHHLLTRDIVTAPRGDRLRIAPHFYNNATEVDEFVAALP
ncbi:MAG TPA: aminotransferase class V-fold PLP-dependent enzyme [Pyrinomonadaceae bacterium]|jgi:selenocysteine lyase/cysteine desulfurase|nr:aminotransferase class V-fold PLP-dependent enzyme [Pyrinomonadaceae bacterium]